MHLIKYFIFGSLLLLVGCSHVVRFPGSMNQRPQIAGRTLGGNIEFALNGATEVVVFSDYTANPPVRKGSGSIEPHLGVGGGIFAGLGLVESLDVYYTNALGLRWLFYGDPNGKEWRATVFGGSVGRTEESSTNSGSNTYKARTVLNGWEYGVSVGRYVEEQLLLYFTVGTQTGSGKTTVSQPSQSFDYDDRFDHLVGTMGLQVESINKSFYFLAEVSTTKTTWAGTDGNAAGSGLLGLGFKW